MDSAGQHVVAALRTAREKKGFSQRTLSAKAGMPQSYISRMERGMVDLQLSSLIELARVLDLEVMTIPRKLVPAVEAVIRGQASSSQTEGPTVRPAYTLDEDDDA